MSLGKREEENQIALPLSNQMTQVQLWARKTASGEFKSLYKNNFFKHNKKGIKFYPGYGRRIGNKIFSFHHIEYKMSGGKVEILAHYDLIHIDEDEILKKHEDPEIIHPDEP